MSVLLVFRGRSSSLIGANPNTDDGFVFKPGFPELPRRTTGDVEATEKTAHGTTDSTERWSLDLAGWVT